MLIVWRIRYFDRTDMKFKDHDLFLDTTTLSPVMRAAVELLTESKGNQSDRNFLRFKSLFREHWPFALAEVDINFPGVIKFIVVQDYIEDEQGNEITLAELGPLLTGSQPAVFAPSAARQNDIAYIFAEKSPVPIAAVSLTVEETRLLGYFVRDFDELRDSALMKDGSGTIKRGGTLPPQPNGDYHFETAISDDEIRSFMTIFRRLYMKNEPANFLKSVDLFEKAMGGHQLGHWVRGVAVEYRTHLEEVPDFCKRRKDMDVTFTVKRLIDVFVNTQYAHQPNTQRQRQYLDCLQQVGGRRNLLTWLLLTEVWKCGLEIGNAGRVIAGWFKRYCDHHGITPDVLNSLRAEHTGLGTAEKEDARKARLFREKVEELELELWRQAGKPEGGPVLFRLIAQQQLKQALNGEEGMA